MTAPKLTNIEWRALASVDLNGETFEPVEVGMRLDERGLLRWEQGRLGRGRYSLTDAGRAALRDGGK